MNQSLTTIEERSPRNRVLAITLAVFFGYWGVHRFYTGRFWTGLLMFLTGGGFLVWWIIDVLILLTGRFKDGEGRVLGPPQTRALHSLPPASRQSHLEGPRQRQPDEDDISMDDLLEDPLEEEFRKLQQERAHAHRDGSL